tara:strand:+ start:1442 stop:2623 length:1182 start_codon:yes stop_codon:yes gene_type:complete
VSVIPIDKSIAQRCAVLGLDFDKSNIGEDIKSTLNAAEEFADYQKDLTLNLGNSGTGMRLLTGYIAGFGKECTLIGDESLSKRPMDRIAEPLKDWGADIDLRDHKFSPIKINPSNLQAEFTYDLKIPSAQIKSCLLLAALSSKTKIEIIENIPSRDHTERILEECEADIRREGNRIILDGKKDIIKKYIDIPGDFSSAAYLMAANILSKKTNQIENVGVNKTRVAFLQVLGEMGAMVMIRHPSIESNETRANLVAFCEDKLKGVTIDGDRIPNLIDEIPLIAILAMFAEGKTIVRDAKELRYKESDRISLLLSNIKSFNPDIGIKEFDDGFEIEPAEDKNMGIVKIKTGGDHRMAMSFMVASLRSGKKVEFDDMECVETSFPGFFNLIKKWYQ